MNSYEQYSKKIDSLASFIAKIIKFKYLILSIILLILASIATLLGIKGIITSPISCNQEILYGENQVYNSSALMSDVYYEFRKKGNANWSSIEPYLPGEYEVRSVSKRTFGFKSYSEIETFVIKKRDLKIELNSENIVFDTLPEISYELASGDYIKEIQYNYEPLNQINSKISLATVKIFNSDDEDVTNCYNVLMDEKNINFLKKDITITTSSKTKIYDGTPLFEHSFNSTINKNYNIVFDSDAYLNQITNVGRILNEIDPKKINIVDNNNNNYNDLFNNNYKFGYLEVEKRKVYITTNDANFTYNATSFSNDKFSVKMADDNSGLVNGHEIRCVNKSEYINAGVHDNILEFKIYDENNNDVTENYELCIDYGKITIDKTDVDIYINYEKIYDGMNVKPSDLNIDAKSLKDGDTINVSFNTALNDVGEYDEKYIVLYFYNKNNILIDNYNVNIESKIIINKRNITIESSTNNFIFNNDYIADETYSVYNLVQSHKVSVINSTKIINVGEYDNIQEYRIFDKNKDVTDNYQIKKNNGVIKVSPYSIDIKVSGSMIYDDDIFDNNLLYYSYNDSNLLFADHDLKFSIINNNYITCNTYNDVELDISVINTLKENYNITYKCSIEIKKRNIQINTLSKEKVYDGKFLTSKEFNYEKYNEELNSGLISNHEVLVIDGTLTSILNVSKVENKFNVIIYKNYEDITNNYNISYDYGYLEITKRNLVVSTMSKTKVYDGEKFKYFEYNVEKYNEELNSGLVEDSIVTSVDDLPIGMTDVGVYENKFSINIYYKENLVNYNYNILYNYGLLEITRRNINIETLSNSKVYDGQVFSHPYFKNEALGEESGLLNNNSIVILESTITSIRDVSKVLNEFTVDIYNGLDKITFNYNITYNYGFLEITKRNISVSFSGNSIYDGTKFKEVNLTYNFNEDTSLVYGHVIKYIILNNNYIDVNTYSEVQLNIDILSNDLSVLNNYDVYYECTLIITKRIVDLNVFGTMIYNDNIFNNENLYYKYNGNYELVNNHSVKFNIINNEYIEVGIYKDVMLSISVFDLENDRTNNYDITYDCTIQILRKDILVSTGSKEKVYDGKILKCLDFTIDGLIISHEAFVEDENVSCILNVDSIDNKFKVIIKNKNLEDVTNNYSIEYAWGLLKINPRPIDVETMSKEKVYDGKTLFDNNFEYESNNQDRGLLDGEDIIAESNYPSITYFGNIENKFSIIIKNSRLEDVTNNYSINYIYGTLEITKRNILINTSSDSKEYDGTPLENDSFIYESFIDDKGLVETDSIISINIPKIVDVSKVLNKLEVEIKDSNNNIINDSYNITYDYGYLEITKRCISIDVTGSKVYDDQVFDLELSFSYNSLNELVLNHKFTFDILENIYKYIGTYNRVLLDINVLEDGINKTNNYDIIYSVTLIINKRKLSVITSSDSKIYDESPLTNSNFEYEKYNLELDSGLIDGQNIEVDDKTIPSIIEVGEIDNDFSVIIKDKVKNDVTSNYDISYTYGKLLIKPRLLYVDIRANKIYDANKVMTSDLVYSNNIDNEIEFDITILDDIINAGIYKDVKLDISIKSDNKIYDNYEIIYSIIITIEKRSININTKSKDFIYAGNYFKYSEFEYEKYNVDTNSGLIDGNEIEFIDGSNSDIINVGQYENIFEVKITSGFDDNTENYDINYSYGTINILKRNIDVSTSSKTRIYNGFALSSNEFTFEEFNIDNNSGLINGNIIEASIDIPSIINVGEISNEFEVIIKNNEEDITANYNIIYNYGTLKITKRSMNVTTLSKSKIYDGLPLTFNEFEYNLQVGDFGLVSSDRISSNNDTLTSIVSFGETDNIFEVSIYNNQDEDISNNYEILYKYGKLSISRRNISIKISGSMIYKDEIFDSELNYIYDSEYELVLDHKFVFEVLNNNYIDVGRYENAELNINIIDSSNISQFQNYEISSICILEITKRDIDVITSSKNKIYDGEFLTSNKYEVKNLISSHNTMINSELSQIKYANTTDNIFSIVVLKNGVDITKNYNIIYNYGILEIIPRKIIIRTHSKTKVYDASLISCDTFDWEGKSTERGLLEIDKIILNRDSVISFSNVSKKYNELKFNIYNNELDITSSYDINLEYGTLEITPREINISSPNITRIYDGTYLDSFEFDYEVENGTRGLLNNQKIEIDSYTRFKDVIKTKNEITVYIKDSLNICVNDNYNILYNYGDYEITQRNIRIITKSNDLVYNGYNIIYDYFEFEEQSLTSGLVDIHTICYKENSSKVLDFVGTHDNIFEVSIFDEDSIDVTLNYNISYSYGKINILRRKIDINVFGSMAYNGNVFNDKLLNYSYNDDSYQIVEGHEILFEIEDNNYIEVASYNDVKLKIDILSQELSVLDNYEIICKCNIEITKREVKIHFFGNKIYDALPYNTLLKWEYYNSDFELKENHKLIYNFINASNYINAGTYNDLVIQYNVYDEENNSVLDNYNIIVSSTLNIMKRDISLKLTSTKVYNDLSYIEEVFMDYNDSLYEVLDIHRLSYSFENKNEIINAGVYDENSLNFTFNICDINGIDVFDNYNIEYSALIEITKLDITFKVFDLSKEYDGTKIIISKDDINIVNSSLLGGHYYEIVDYNEVIFYDETIRYSNLSVDIYKDLKNVSLNYNINYIDGTLNITKREIDVFVRGIEITYNDDLNNVYNESYYTATNLADNDTFKLFFNYDYITNQKLSFSPILDVNIIITNENGAATNSYIVNYYSDELVNVNKLSVDVILLPGVKYYDGEALTSNLIKYDIKNKDIISVETNGSITEVGQTKNEVISSKVLNRSLVDVSIFYDLTFTDSTLVVLENNVLTINLKSMTKTYDGESIDINSLISFTGIVDDDKVVSKISYKEDVKDAINVGDYNFTINFEIKTKNNKNIMDNKYVYIVETGQSINDLSGSIKILKKNIVVESSSYLVINGEIPEDAKKYTVSSLAVNDIISVKFKNNYNDKNEFEVSIYNKSNQDVTDNYNIECIFGNILYFDY